MAEMTVGYKAIRETFTSRVTLDRPRLKILVEYVDGPFRHLENRWNFKALDAGCDVEFYINYEFRSRTLGLLMGRCSSAPSASSPKRSSSAPTLSTASPAVAWRIRRPDLLKA